MYLVIFAACVVGGYIAAGGLGVLVGLVLFVLLAQ